ncbi:MAG: exodeoxyribonuclease VII small subunit [Bacilli bacterium]|nr:exodeoxyribonuclease VII small subunit [Acholeplasmataceae bacterium]MDY2901991.1 exodeoxyribonuclease VII small subunit [Bacilli bacterium]
MKFEELLKELEEIVKELESGNLSLDDSIKKYQKGIELSAECQKMLEDAKSIIITKVE